MSSLTTKLEQELFAQPSVHALAGAGGSALAYGITYPLVTISTRLQVQIKKDAKIKYSSTLDAFVKIFQEEGFVSFYSGLTSGIFGVALTNGIYYYWYQFFKRFFEGKGPNKDIYSTTANLTIGSLAGVITSILTNPIWVVNTQMQVQRSNKTTWKTAKDIYQNTGLLGFFKGLVPALILVSNPAIQYTVFEKLRVYLEKVQAQKGKKLSPFHFFLLGAIAKTIATLFTYPYVVVKSRMQIHQTGPKSTMDIFKSIFKDQGIIGFYKGLDSRILSSVLNAAFLFLFKEELTTITIKFLLLFKRK